VRTHRLVTAGVAVLVVTASLGSPAADAAGSRLRAAARPNGPAAKFAGPLRGGNGINLAAARLKPERAIPCRNPRREIRRLR